MTGSTDVVAAFPAAGAGGSTLEELEKLAARRGMAYVELANPASLEALASGEWEAASVDRLRRAVRAAAAGRVLLVGHCMGGLSAIRLAAGLDPRLGVPVSLLAVNTPCPDAAGRIPTMSGYSDAEIAAVLAQDGFPQELLDDEDMLAEIADGLRHDATVADRLAEWIGSAGDLDTLHVLSTRGDTFIPPEHCVPWHRRVSREFQLTIAPGGHALDHESIGVLDHALDAVLATARAGVA